MSEQSEHREALRSRPRPRILVSGVMEFWRTGVLRIGQKPAATHQPPITDHWLLTGGISGPDLVVVAPFETFRRISQNSSPAGVTLPFLARAMPADSDSVVPVIRR